MKKIILIPMVVAAIFSKPSSAQLNYDYFDANNVEALISPVANHFWDYSNSRYHVPKTGQATSIFTSTFWIGGKDENGQLHLAAERFRQNGNDFTPGPVGDTNSYTLPNNGAWNRVWKITKAEVATWLNDPQNVPIPQSVLDWPGNGNVLLGQSLELAPFMDLNGDGQYDPTNLEYPIFKGDQAVYFIFNDDASAHTESGGAKLGIEVHGMAYGFDCPVDTALNHALFMEYKVFNRSQNDYQDVYVGSWTDFDLGNAQDDYVGSDPLRNLVFAYNGDDIDEDNNDQFGYDTNLASQGIRLLNGLKLADDSTDNVPSIAFGGNYNGFGMNDSVMDNERLGMYSFRYHSNSPGPLGDPYSPSEYYNMMTSKWLDGTPFTYGGNGYDPNNPAAIETRFMFPDSSDNVFLSTGGDTVPPWDEMSAGNTPADRRGLFSMGPIDLPANGVNSFEMVYVFAQKMNDRLGAVHKMKDYSDSLQHLYNLGVTACGEFENDFSDLVGNKEHAVSSIQVYPNPSSGLINISGLPSSGSIKIHNLQGQLVLNKMIDRSVESIQLEGMPKGVYILEIENETLAIQKKIVLE